VLIHFHLQHSPPTNSPGRCTLSVACSPLHQPECGTKGRPLRCLTWHWQHAAAQLCHLALLPLLLAAAPAPGCTWLARGPPCACWTAGSAATPRCSPQRWLAGRGSWARAAAPCTDQGGGMAVGVASAEIESNWAVEAGAASCLCSQQCQACPASPVCGCRLRVCVWHAAAPSLRRVLQPAHHISSCELLRWVMAEGRKGCASGATRLGHRRRAGGRGGVATSRAATHLGGTQ